jgi:hypothetical protein
MPVFIGLFIPNQYFMDYWIIGQQPFIPFPQHEINFCLRKMGRQLLHQGRRQHHIADKGGLNDQYFIKQSQIP